VTGQRVMRVALIGFGTVGQGFAHILARSGDWYRRQFGLDLRIVAVSDLQRGSVHDPAGLDPAVLLERAGDLARVPAPVHGWDSLRTIRESNAEAVLEMTFTDLQTGEPGLSHARAALGSGKHLVTSNKGPVALHIPELQRLARDNGVTLGMEATVMSGTPTLALATEMLRGAIITRVEGILNGTSNYILTEMEGGSSFGEALRRAQELGYAEANPAADIDGTDARAKAAILANLLLDAPLTPDDVECTGIRDLTGRDIEEARAAGQVWKLVAGVEAGRDGVRARVAPQRLPLSHPLASIDGVTNAITFTTEYLGEVTLTGPGAGRLETGYAMVGDLLKIHRQGLRAAGDEPKEVSTA